MTRGIGKLNASNPTQPMTIYGDTYPAPGRAVCPGADHEHRGRAGREGLVHRRLLLQQRPEGALGWIDPANPSTVHEVAIPSDKVGIAFYDSQIIAGPSGSLWFTEATLSGGGVTSSAIAVYFPSSGQFGEIPLSAATRIPCRWRSGPTTTSGSPSRWGRGRLPPRPSA